MATSTATLSMTKSVVASRNWVDLEHYLIAAYGSMEHFNQRIVAIDPTLDAPTWLVSSGTRKRNQHNTLALMLPSLEALTLDLAQEHTRMGTDYIGVRLWPEKQRRRGGIINPYACPELTCEITDEGTRSRVCRLVPKQHRQ